MSTKTHTLTGHKFTTAKGETVVIFVNPEGRVESIQNGEALQPMFAAAAAKDQHRLGPTSMQQSPLPGVTLQRDANGVLRPVVSSKAQRDMQFFVPTIPCWFGGCEELRNEYLNEVADLEAKDNCADCEKGALIRKYLKRIANLSHGGPTEADLTVGRWVTELVTDNPIAGTDALRSEFFAEKAAMTARHEAAGSKCKPCDLGALIRKYRARLESVGRLS